MIRLILHSEISINDLFETELGQIDYQVLQIINEGLSFTHQKFDRFFNGTPSEVKEEKMAVVADASIPIM